VGHDTKRAPQLAQALAHKPQIAPYSHGHALCSAVRMTRALILALTSTLTLGACGVSGSTSGSEGGSGGANAGSGGASAGSGGANAGAAGASAGAAGTGGANAGSGGAAAGSAGVGGASAGAGGGGPLACGSQTCGPTQYCVKPCCGGAPPMCVMKPDGGTCPVGTHAGCSFPGSQCTTPAACCEYDPCTTPPPYCSDTMPVGCFTQGRTCQMACA